MLWICTTQECRKVAASHFKQKYNVIRPNVRLDAKDTIYSQNDLWIHIMDSAAFSRFTAMHIEPITLRASFDNMWTNITSEKPFFHYWVHYIHMAIAKTFTKWKSLTRGIRLVCDEKHVDNTEFATAPGLRNEIVLPILASSLPIPSTAIAGIAESHRYRHTTS